MPSPRDWRSSFGALLLPLALLTACGAEDPPRLTDSGPRRAEIPHQDQRTPASGAVLAAIGRQSFDGPVAFRCVLHDERGLQVNFRTSDPDLPTVAVRIQEFQGAGPYRARLFVTGRSRTGALVTSTGEANVQVKQKDRPGGEGAVALLSGTFEGDYSGGAGKGSIQGRFGLCGYSGSRGGSPAPLAAASGATGVAGAEDEETSGP
jgi:hypothetical protein